MKARDNLKRDLLKHYRTREPHPFYQFDTGFNMPPTGDLGGGDEDGDSCTSGVTYELMNGNTDVRVLIRAGSTVKDVRRALAKTRKWLKRDGFDFHIKQLAKREARLNAEICQHCGKRPDRMRRHPARAARASNTAPALLLTSRAPSAPVSRRSRASACT